MGLLAADAVRRWLSDGAAVVPRRADLTARIGRQIEMDNEVLEQAAAVASRLGCTVDQVIEDVVRRDLAARLLEPLLAGDRRNGPELSEGEALELAYLELDAVRGRSETPRR